MNYAAKIAEILSSLETHDVGFGLRRMLDLARETRDTQLMQRAVDTSVSIRNQLNEEGAVLSHNQLLLVKQCLAQLESKLPADDTTAQPALLCTADQLTKQYARGRFCLQNVSFDIHAGEVIGVVGENGNGKTTLLQCVAGYLAIDSGQLIFPSLADQGYAAIQAYIGFIPQRIPKWYGSLRENLHFSAAVMGLRGNDNEIQVRFMLERLGLSDYAHHTWDQLSSGYRTRFELARTLLRQPSLLVFDEPLANLDINAQQTLLADLKNMAASQSNPLGILLSSQQLFEVEKVADRVILLRQGEQIDIEKQQSDDVVCVVELETPLQKEALLQLFQGEPVDITFNGNYYTLVSRKQNLQELLQYLISKQAEILYYRDITHSTKRFF